MRHGDARVVSRRVASRRVASPRACSLQPLNGAAAIVGGIGRSVGSIPRGLRAFIVRVTRPFAQRERERERICERVKEGNTQTETETEKGRAERRAARFDDAIAM